MTVSNFNIICVNSSNVHTNTCHVSSRPTEPYKAQNSFVADFAGSGFCCMHSLYIQRYSL